ncbi:hypothetical protein HOY82DRAFT_213000 [Tuber indicum]|nr:hypothetical protein HOY82DRAFT_213000 [Tuber indicum]
MLTFANSWCCLFVTDSLAFWKEFWSLGVLDPPWREGMKKKSVDTESERLDTNFPVSFFLRFLSFSASSFGRMDE